jgi:hypothetical protein
VSCGLLLRRPLHMHVHLSHLANLLCSFPPKRTILRSNGRCLLRVRLGDKGGTLHQAPGWATGQVVPTSLSFFPRQATWLTGGWIVQAVSWLGLAIVTVGELIRKAAMVSSSGMPCRGLWFSPPPRKSKHRLSQPAFLRLMQITARHSFTHLIQFSKREEHQLVRGGIYRFAIWQGPTGPGF